MRSVNDDCANFIDKSDARFRAIQRSCEFLFRFLHTCRDGVGVQFRHTVVISIDEEDQLWQMNVLNVIEPKGLQITMTLY